MIQLALYYDGVKLVILNLTNHLIDNNGTGANFVQALTNGRNINFTRSRAGTNTYMTSMMRREIRKSSQDERKASVRWLGCASIAD